MVIVLNESANSKWEASLTIFYLMLYVFCFNKVMQKVITNTKHKTRNIKQKS